MQLMSRHLCKCKLFAIAQLDKLFHWRNNADMSKMRSILKAKMADAGHRPADIARATGLQTSTITRFLRGDTDHLRTDTVMELAKLYGLTESQLRGDVLIPGIPAEQQELKDLLPLDEYTFMSNVKRLRPEARAILHSFAEMLVAEPESEYKNEPAERRERDVYPNPQKRVGESRHKSSINKNRRIPLEIRRYHKSSHSA